MHIPTDLDKLYGNNALALEHERPFVLSGPYECHSNDLPWLESIAGVVTIGEDADGQSNQAQLADELRAYADPPLKIGLFCAASNVTGILSETNTITRLLHEHGALALSDLVDQVHRRPFAYECHLSARCRLGTL